MSVTYVPAELRRLVRSRARECCEYCLLPESGTLAIHEIDHVIAEKHRGATIADNLALACLLCNKHKGSDLTTILPGRSDYIPLFHPRRDSWPEHFRLEADGTILAITDIGSATAQLLCMNEAERVEERRLLLHLGLFAGPIS